MTPSGAKIIQLLYMEHQLVALDEKGGIWRLARGNTSFGPALMKDAIDEGKWIKVNPKSYG